MHGHTASGGNSQAVNQALRVGLPSQVSLVACWLLASFTTELAWAQQAAGKTSGVVATVHPLATRAGAAALESGGNAVDAAIAAALTLGVVDGFNSGIGGGCFILIRRADGRLVAIDGRETAPAAAHRDMFLRNGKADTQLSQVGPLASGVPGAVAAYWSAHREHGSRSWRSLVTPAADLAERGFQLDAQYAGKLRATAELLARFEGSRQVLLRPDGQPWEKGQWLRQPELARTYRLIAARGARGFYEGAIPEAVEQWMTTHGGLLDAKDFAGYQALTREPIRSQYRGHTIIGFPPPSSGGVHVAQILNTLEHFDLARLYRQDRAQFVHVIAEAMKPAFADRAHWLGDPAYAQVPKGLIDPHYAARLARRIRLDAVTPVDHGQPPGDAVFGKHTTHIAAADQLGNWVAITATINTTFGSKVVIPGTGIVMNNEMDDFSIQPGVPNAFGLVGAEANAVAAGKRPLSSMSPTIVLRDGRPVMTVGAAGGPKIITQVVLAIIARVDLKLPVEQVLAAPRFHHQWQPDQLFVERGVFPDALLARLRSFGHDVAERESVGVCQAIVAGEDGRLVGAHDPRVPGLALQVPAK